MSEEQTLFSTKEAAAYVGLSVQGLKRSVRVGKVRCTIVSRVAVFERRDLDAFKASREAWKAGVAERKKQQLALGRERFRAKRKAEREAYIAKRRAEVEAEMNRIVVTRSED